MAKKAYIGVDGKARKIKKGYIGVLDKMVRFDGDMHYDADGESWVTDSFAYVEHKENFTTAHVEFDGVLYKDLYVETYISNGKTFKYVYIPDTDINIEFNSDGNCELYDPSWELDTGRTYSLKIYTGNLESVARKIKKAYIGIGGVARPCWSGGELAYYGTIDGLSKASRLLAATTIGDYALFGGGADPSVNSVGTVNAYNSSLVKSNPASLSPARYALSATTVGNYAIFGGGRYTSSRLRADTCYFDGSLTYGHVGTSMNKEREYYAATTVGSYALFGGGLVNSAAMRNLDIYDTSLTSHTTTTPLSSGRYYLGATTVGDYALFGGGYNGAASQTTVDAFNKTLTRSTPTAFAYVRYYVAATAVGNYALFAGSLSGASNTVDAYNSSLTRTSATVLSVSRGDMAATTVNGFAVFAGGFGSGGETHETCVDVYDASLTRTTGQSLSTGRGAFAATTVGNYAIFAGGMNLSVGPVSTVEAYTVA